MTISHFLYNVWEMAHPTSLGQFEQLVLTAILSLGDNAYGVTIHAEVEALSGLRKTALGAVYATLDRMEDKGLVRSWLSDPTPERGGRAKRHFRLEEAGRRALRELGADGAPDLRRRRTLLGREDMAKDLRNGGPPAPLSALLRLLIPPPAREAVLGDLEERYRSPIQYASEGIQTMPYLIASRARRTSSVAIVGLQTFVLIACLGVTLPDLPGQSVPSWAQGGIPAAAALLALALRAVYRGEETPVKSGLLDAVAAAVAMLLSQGVLAALVSAGQIGPDWLLPRGLYMLGVFALPALWIIGAAEGRHGARPAGAPAEAVVQDYLRFERSVKARNRAEMIALGLIVAGSAAILLRFNPPMAPIAWPFLAVFVAILAFLALRGWARADPGRGRPRAAAQPFQPRARPPERPARLHVVVLVRAPVRRARRQPDPARHPHGPAAPHRDRRRRLGSAGRLHHQGQSRPRPGGAGQDRGAFRDGGGGLTREAPPATLPDAAGECYETGMKSERSDAEAKAKSEARAEADVRAGKGDQP